MDKYLEIRKKFEENENFEKAIEMSAYMRKQFLFYGIETKLRREIYKDVLKDAKKDKKIDWIFLSKCFNDSHREFQYLVSDYLAYMKDFLTFDDIERIKKYITEKSWWDTVDSLDNVIGNIKDSRLDDLMLSWSMDDNFWLRRVAIDHQLLYKEKTNTTLLEKIIVNNLGSKEFFINKAIGWSLREYSKTNPSWVRNFLKKYKDKLSKLSIREASKYL